jgi:hypothetical protein
MAAISLSHFLEASPKAPNEERGPRDCFDDL